MKISSLTVITSLMFAATLAYQFFAPKGLCGETNFFLCEFYMDQVMRIGYFLLVLAVTSLGIDFFFSKYRRAWIGYLLFALPVALLILFTINTGTFHTPSAGSSGMGDIYNMLFDKLYAYIVYGIFFLGSIGTIFIAHRRTKKANAK